MLDTLKKIFGNRGETPVVSLYSAIVAQARQPRFYADWSVPDTVDGRFDMIVLHAFLLMRRLGTLGPQGQTLSQDIFDLFMGDMDRNMREMGVGDLGVGKKVKAMARGFFGRVAAYDAALAAQDAGALAEALRRNLFGTVGDPGDGPARVAEYCLAQMAELERQDSADLLAGRMRWLGVS